jgi:hypothetical protein
VAPTTGSTNLPGPKLVSGEPGSLWGASRAQAAPTGRRASGRLGLIAADVENGAIELAFEASEDFITPLGRVLEGFLCRDAPRHGRAPLLGTLEPDQFITTLDLQASATSTVTQLVIASQGA